MKSLQDSTGCRCLASCLLILAIATAPVSLCAQQKIKTIIIDNYQPYTFLGEKNIPDGFSVEISRAAAQAMDLELDIRVDTWASAIRELESGGIDLLPMMAYSAERALLFDFSTPHTIAFDAIFQRKDAADIHSLKGIAGKTVIVMNKDIAHQYLVSSGLAKSVTLVLVDSLPEALKQLSAGKGDAAIMPKLVGLMTLKSLKLGNIELTPKVVDNYTRPFSFAVKKNNQPLLERLNQGLNIIKSNGEYETIYKKWFATLEDPHLPLKTALRIGAIAVFVLFLFMIWNLILNGRVKLKTDKLLEEIEKRKISEMLLKESEKEWRVLAESMPQIVWITRPDGKNIYFNRQWVEYTGLTLEESLGDGWNEPFHPDDKNRAMDAWRNATSNKGIYTLECRIRRFDGIYTWWLIRGVPVLDENGAIYKWFGTCTDIEEIKQAEIKIRSLLGEKVLLLKEVHHRIKNNMNTIKGLLSLQIDAERNPSAAASLKDAEGRVQSIIMLYDRLYCTDNYLELSVREYLVPLMHEVVGSFPTAAKVGIMTEIYDCILNVQFLTPLGIVINELLTNMMKHAFKGRDKGTVFLGISLQENHLTVILEDDGIGLPESVTLKNSTGFGMMMVGMLLEQLGGDMRIERKTGTRFTITFDV